MAKNYYPEEFRRQAVDLYESTPDQTMQSIAMDLGMSRSALDTWVAKYGTGVRAPAAQPLPATSDADNPEVTISRLESSRALTPDLRHLVVGNYAAIGSVFLSRRSYSFGAIFPIAE